MIYGITLLLPQSASLWLYTDVISPISDLFTEVLRAISGPLIFCSIACSIVSMGDVSTFGKIGKRTITTLILSTCFVMMLGCGWLVFLYPPTSASASGGNAFSALYALLLSIIPTNLFGAFVDNNPMQIVTLSIVTGFSLLALQKKTTELTHILEQCNHVLQYIMEFLSDSIHLFVFLSVLGLLLSGQISVLLDAHVLFILIAISFLITACYSFLKACFTTHISPRLLLKKLAPAFLIALATASSSAAFSASLKTCKEKLGINPKLVDFGLPFGQVVYMPASAPFFGVLGFFLYRIYDLEISLSMLVMLFLLGVILSIALPPIPGGGLIVLNILFLQLGIPDEGLSLAIIASTLCAFPDTAICVSSLQIELLCIAKKLNLLDEDTLHSR